VLRSVSENAKARFPHYVHCSTAHSLAFRAVGWKYDLYCSCFSIITTAHLFFQLSDSSILKQSLSVPVLNNYLINLMSVIIN